MSEVEILLRQIANLRDECDFLKERVEELTRLISRNDIIWPREWKLTPSEGRLFGVFVARPFVTRDTFMAALYRDNGRDEPDIKIVDVFISKMRRKLGPFGITFSTIYGRGWMLDNSVRATIASTSASGNRILPDIAIRGMT